MATVTCLGGGGAVFGVDAEAAFLLADGLALRDGLELGDGLLTTAAEGDPVGDPDSTGTDGTK